MKVVKCKYCQAKMEGPDDLRTGECIECPVCGRQQVYSQPTRIEIPTTPRASALSDGGSEIQSAIGDDLVPVDDLNDEAENGQTCDEDLARQENEAKLAEMYLQRRRLELRETMIKALMGLFVVVAAGIGIAVWKNKSEEETRQQEEQEVARCREQDERLRAERERLAAQAAEAAEKRREQARAEEERRAQEAAEMDRIRKEAKAQEDARRAAQEAERAELRRKSDEAAAARRRYSELRRNLIGRRAAWFDNKVINLSEDGIVCAFVGSSVGSLEIVETIVDGTNGCKYVLLNIDGNSSELTREELMARIKIAGCVFLCRNNPLAYIQLAKPVLSGASYPDRDAYDVREALLGECKVLAHTLSLNLLELRVSVMAVGDWKKNGSISLDPIIRNDIIYRSDIEKLLEPEVAKNMPRPKFKPPRVTVAFYDGPVVKKSMGGKTLVPRSMSRNVDSRLYDLATEQERMVQDAQAEYEKKLKEAVAEKVQTCISEMKLVIRCKR